MSQPPVGGADSKHRLSLDKGARPRPGVNLRKPGATPVPASAWDVPDAVPVPPSSGPPVPQGAPGVTSDDPSAPWTPGAPPVVPQAPGMGAPGPEGSNAPPPAAASEPPATLPDDPHPTPSAPAGSGPIRRKLVLGAVLALATIGVVGGVLASGTGRPATPAPAAAPGATAPATTSVRVTSGAPATPGAASTMAPAPASPTLRQVYAGETVSTAGRYVNTAFGFACTLPVSWPRTDLAGGQGVAATQGTAMATCVGRPNDTGSTLSGVKGALKNRLLAEGYDLTYDHLGKETYAVSGWAGDRGYYEWGLVSDREIRMVRWTFTRQDMPGLDAPITRSVKEFATSELG